MLDAPFESAVPFSDMEINEIELSIGRKLPKDYCDFVQKYGGAFVGGMIEGADDLSILGFFGGDEHKGVRAKLRTHPDLRDDGVLPIADCELGNLYVLDPENAVHYINYYGGKTAVQKVANSFEEFVARILVQDD